MATPNKTAAKTGPNNGTADADEFEVSRPGGAVPGGGTQRVSAGTPPAQAGPAANPAKAKEPAKESETAKVERKQRERDAALKKAQDESFKANVELKHTFIAQKKLLRQTRLAKLGRQYPEVRELIAERDALAAELAKTKAK